MRNQVLKMYERSEVAEMIYMCADGTLTKRRLKILSVHRDSFIAYCYLRRAQRTFKVERVLSLWRVRHYESEAI